MVNKEPSIIFPPFNHEGIHHHDHNHNHEYVHKIDIEQAEPSPPITPPGAHWWDVGVQILQSKLVGIVSFIRRFYMNGGGLFWTHGSLAGVMVVMLLFYLRSRRGKRLRRESIGQLIGVIKEKDERIRQLLYQIAKMNEILLTIHHGVPMISKADSG